MDKISSVTHHSLGIKRIHSEYWHHISTYIQNMNTYQQNLFKYWITTWLPLLNHLFSARIFRREWYSTLLGCTCKVVTSDISTEKKGFNLFKNSLYHFLSTLYQIYTDTINCVLSKTNKINLRHEDLMHVDHSSDGVTLNVQFISVWVKSNEIDS